MVRCLGKIQINKSFLRFLHSDSKKTLKDILWSKIKIISVDCDKNGILTFIAESEILFSKIIIGKMFIPFYDIVLHTNEEGSLNGISIKKNIKKS